MPRFCVRSVTLALAAPAALAALLAGHASAAIIDTIAVGRGENMSTIQVDFSNGDGYVFEFSYDGTATGFSALQSIEKLFPEFTLDYSEHPVFGPLVGGIGVFRDYEYGTGDLWPVVENYWHYWVKDTGEWDFAPIGAAGRTLFDGSHDGWVFGSPVPPQAIPAPQAAFLGLIAAAACRRRRR